MNTTTANTAISTGKAPWADIYTRVTDRIVEQLSRGVKPWLTPWNAEHAAGRITRPLRCKGEPHRGVNVLMLWDAAFGNGISVWEIGWYEIATNRDAYAELQIFRGMDRPALSF